MTIGITFSDYKEIMLVSDEYRYLLMDGVVEDALLHKLQITHENFEQCVQTIERNAPKIFRFGKNIGILATGDCRFSSILTTLNKRGNITKQILEQLKQKKLEGFWSCRIGKYNTKKEKTEMVSITYENGKVNIIEHDRDTVGFDSFSPEMKDVFFKKYVTAFYVGNTEEKITVVKEFFEEISTLYNNKAGGEPVIAKIDRNGFQWITKPKLSRSQNFTTYSLNFMPTKIDTESTTQVAWSSDTNWTDILELAFECESKMILFIHAYTKVTVYKEASADHKQIGSDFKLTLDGTDVDTTSGHVASDEPATLGYWLKSGYSCHDVLIVEKGSHTLRIAVRMMGGTGVTAYYYDRRLSILKGFYQGGTI